MTLLLLVQTLSWTPPAVHIGLSGMVPLQTQNLLYGHGVTASVRVTSWRSWVHLYAEADLSSFLGEYRYRVQMASVGPGIRLWTPLAQIDVLLRSAWIQRMQGTGRERGMFWGYGLGVAWQWLHLQRLASEVTLRFWSYPGRLSDFRFFSIGLNVLPKF